ncbi:MAG: hypothetical protein IJ964_05290, partial [Campylobacter sp.]|nr:hypothetical protein [Campylobacter sp.]
MTKIKLSALACAILVGGGQQLVAEDSNNIIDLGNYSYQTVDINNEKKIITGNSEGAVINVKNNGELISRVSDFFYTDINIKKNSNATFENEVWLDNPKLHIKNNSNAIFENEVSIEYPNFHIINNSTAVFNKALYMWNADDDRWPVIEQDNDFSGGNLSLDNSTLDIKGRAEFNTIDVLINQGSTATINNLEGYNSKIYVVNDSKLEINKDAGFHSKTHLMVKDNSTAKIDNLTGYVSEIYVVNDSELEINQDVEFYNKTHLIVEDNSSAKIDNLTANSRSVIYVVNDSELEINKDAFFAGSHLIVKDDSNTTINGALTVEDYGNVVKDDIEIAKSNLNVEGEVYFNNVDTELNNSSNANFKNKLTLIGSAMLLKYGSRLDVGGVADFTNSALVVKNGSKVTFGNNFTMKNGRAEKSIIILDNGSEINVKGDFENHGIIYYGASADSAPKIIVDGKATLMGTTEIGVYATSGDISNLNQAVFLESKEEIENQATDDNIYAMYF